ncbi:MAG: hypothetical protein KatS3mg105_0143 [Gemmatales bacterium]|nr:MAG: hypothetical protein KatS3mg105_0143 [Gemmatales bacterium]
MHQVIFRIPYLDVPIYGFGLMLFLAFIVCSILLSRRARREGIDAEHVQNLLIWVFIPGIIGARIVYMIQYHQPVSSFFKIWEGGLVFYGSAIGGVVGYIAAYFLIIRRYQLSGWKIADIIAPAIAIGLAIGRLGCLLNGCCYGHVACSECPAIHFPLSAPPRYSLVDQGWQTAAGFTLAPTRPEDPRTVIGLVEPGSPAEAAGLKPGDRVVEVGTGDGQLVKNAIIVELHGQPDSVQNLIHRLAATKVEELLPGTVLVYYDSPSDYEKDRSHLQSGSIKTLRRDLLIETLVFRWPRGAKTLQLTVERGGQTVELPPFRPVTLGLHPTQIYESISALLIFFLLSAYYPFKRQDGEVMILLMFCYSVHRFLNEVLRNDTDPVAFGMTLSQNGSILLFSLAVVMLLWLKLRPATRS